MKLKVDAKNYRYTEQRFTGSSRIYHMSTKQTMNSEELGNPRTDLRRKSEELTGAEEETEGHRDALVQSG